ncbi:ThiF family adenylyltransferase [Micromonospora sp. ATA51]|uniref:ThiF family adenylyltransferase n=1 Tax=Micromonospora sp. ATA51 TaxID=2806098 RepID=UPI001A3F36EF|nr:ThiF family adenylyltransferase [Micromonospora sp. ATA51]MBM0227022.1 ThiF family adenylyltransferase [Micromonospora sp. ATA51]
MVYVPTDYSRSLLLAATATGGEPESLRGRIEASQVHISVDLTVPGSSTCLRVLVADLRRLPIQLSLDPGHGSGRLGDDLLDQVVSIAAGIDPERPITVGAAPPDALHVQVGVDHAAAHLSGVPDGHGTHIRRPGQPFPKLRYAGSGLGSVLTAAMLTGEIFKTVTALRPGSHRRIEALDFCPVRLFSPHEQAPQHLHVERLALIGAGAIGTAVALILRALEATGEMTVVDRQIFEPPNVITYSLGTGQDAAARLPKVDIVEAALQHMNIRRVHGTVDDFIAQIDAGHKPMPQSVLGAVDNIAARHDLQRIYADLVLDGGTGGRAGTTVSLHEALPTGPCMRCYFPASTTTLTAEQRLHQATGLPLARIARGDQALTEDDLRGLPRQGRQLLERHVGQPVCGLGRVMGLTTAAGDDSYQPSAAFVAQQAASLMVGALIARTHPGGSRIPIRQIEYDTLYGPRPDMVDDRRPRSDCYCQTNADVIRLVRAQRAKNILTQ